MTIKLGDKNEVPARKKGTVQLNELSMEALLVPEFRISLLSVSRLDSYGLTAIFKDGTCSVIDHHGNNLLKEYRLAMRIEMNDRSSISLNAV